MYLYTEIQELLGGLVGIKGALLKHGIDILVAVLLPCYLPYVL